MLRIGSAKWVYFIMETLKIPYQSGPDWSGLLSGNKAEVFSVNAEKLPIAF